MARQDEPSHRALDGNRIVDGERGMIAAVARAHYLDDLSRTEIADMLNISRFKVARLLTRARDEGIVRFEINDSGLPDAVLGERVRLALGLERCEVIRAYGDEAAIREQIGSAAAGLLSDTLHEGEVLGVAWGRTLTATTRQLEELPNLSIVQLTGFVAGDLDSSPVAAAREVSRRSGGEVHPIFAPLYVQDRATAASLRNHPDIRVAMEMFPQVSTALLSVGAWGTASTQVRDVLPPDLLARALAGGCVADIAGILIKQDGSEVDDTFAEHCVNISYEQLRAVPRVIAVAGGAAKAEAVRAVARGGLITELVTDDTLAVAILDGPGQPVSARGIIDG